MLKHIYRTIVLLAVFVASLAYFSSGIKEVTFSRITTTEMSNTSFPVVTLLIGEEEVNLLHGYSSAMESSLMRDTLTPLDSSQSLFVSIDENESTVKKVNYELRDTFDNSLIENGSYSALEKSGDQKTARIKFTTELEQDKEYALTITTVTDESKKINFYTRVVKNGAFHVKESLNYVMDIHKAILDKDKAESVSQYFESSRGSDDTTLNYVNIHSSMDLISFGALKPKVITRVVPQIKEISSDIASIQLSYFIQGKTDDGKEVYQVKEFYRVKYTPGRMYLLNYERTMEADFNIDLFSKSKGEIKLGIANENAADLYVGEGGTNLCFVRNGELWYYSLDENKAVSVFSFRQENSDYIRDLYDQHDIRVLNMNVEGTIDFIVYGYMNRGNYEGRVGITLYRYYPSDTRIEELVYIPVNQPYQILKEKIGDFVYLTYNDVYYFMLNQTIYSYDIVKKQLTQLANHIDDSNYVFSKQQQYIAWEEVGKDGLASEIRVMNLETQQQSKIACKKGYTIRLLGMIDENIVYGMGKTSDVYTTLNGTLMVPCSELRIVDAQGNEKKKYEKPGYYVTGIEVQENVISLQRVKKGEGGFEKASEDHILNQIVEVKEAMEITKRVTEKALTEYYILLNHGDEIAEKPKVSSAVTTIITEETALRLDEGSQTEAYYVYAYGEVEGCYANAGDAVAVADAKVGTVINQNQQIVWARGTRNSKVTLDVQSVYTQPDTDSYEACLDMMGQFTKGKQYQISEVFRSKALEKDSQQLRATLVNLTGATLDEVLYYVNQGRPVIAAKNAAQTILITGYDGVNINYVDPQARMTSKMSMKNAEKLFADAGNVFLSYIK